MEFDSDNVKSLNLDHLGIVAGACKELKIEDRIDSLIMNKDPRRIVSCGKAVVAMIINGLGFVGRTLYMTPAFFANKPVDRLIGKDIVAEDLNEHALGKALDEIAEYGPTDLFARTAFGIVVEHKLQSHSAHLDSTTISMEGEYHSESGVGNENESTVLKINHGFAKQRSDLKQFVIQMAVTGRAELPFWQETLDGNNSDKKSFQETIKKVEAFKKELKNEIEFKWIADSALYNAGNLLNLKNVLWISRVPETIKEAKELTQRHSNAIDWKEHSLEYKYATYKSSYGDIEQRWLLVYSEQAYKKEVKTFEKKLVKQAEDLKKKIKRLSSKEFKDERSASDAIKSLATDFFVIQATFKQHFKYAEKGRPSPDAMPIDSVWKVSACVDQDKEAIQAELNTKGRFILATNDLNSQDTTDEEILKEYKEQQSVERGFRFLKDPWFMLDKVFLKSQRRITALAMVMTLCLFVYNYAQYLLRKKLEEQKETIPNQLGKQISNPTMRWVFQMFSGISIVRIWDKMNKKVIEIVTNMNKWTRKIVNFLGVVTQEVYGFP